MAELVLEKKKTINTLEGIIAGKKYSVPLAGSLTIREIRALQNGDDDGFSFFEKYIPADVIADELTLNDFKAINKAWREASQKDSGVDLGE